MKELSQIRMAVLDALRGAGIQAMEVFPEKQAMAYSGVVAAVGVGAASGKTAGFCHYLGEMKDPETQAVRERYGKERADHRGTAGESGGGLRTRLRNGHRGAAGRASGGSPHRGTYLGGHLLGEDHGNVLAAGRSGMQSPVSDGERRGVRRISGFPTERSYERVSEMRHERPGVYSVYDASSVTSAGRAAKRIGVAALAVKGTANTAVTLTGYGAGVEVFGEDGADTPGMSTLLKLLFANGASTVYAVRVDAGGGLEAYQAAFAALANCDVQVVVCDSSELTIQKALKTAVETASAARGERIGVIGGSGDTAAQLVTRAEAINSERMVLVGPDMKDESGKALSGVFAAAAVAGAIACGADPAVPLNGAELYGISGLQSVYSDNDIDLLVQGGVTPLEDVGGVVSPVRGITTRTKTGSAADSTWRELTTVLIADDVIPAVRSALRSKFARAKNTAQGRGAIRAQTIVELEKKKDAQIIESYGEVAVTAAADDPTVCLVEFSFAVAHGLNQIRLTVHLTV